VGENFTFAIAAGNTDTAFAVDTGTGQIFVANADANAFRFATGPRWFNLTVSVTDAGINGPRYTALTWVNITITQSNRAPTIVYYNLTVNELVPAGTFVGNVTGDNFESQAGGTERITYAISPRGPNVNRACRCPRARCLPRRSRSRLGAPAAPRRSAGPFPFQINTTRANPQSVGTITVKDDGPIDWNEL